MQDTIVAVFDRFDQARDAMTALLDHGFERGAIQLNPHADATGVRRASSSAEQTGEHVGEPESGIAHFFRSLFGLQDRHAHEDMYVEAVRRGSSILTVLAGSERRRDEAMEILMRFHPVDLDERVEHWRREGREGHVAHRSPIGQSAQAAASTPASADTSPADAPGVPPPSAGAAEGEAGFPKYGPLRVYPHAGGEAVQHGAAPARRKTDYDDTLASAEDADYRSHWRNVYGLDSGRYEDFDAAYRYGAMAPTRLGMQDARWEEAEAELRDDWEARHPDQPWELVREAVRYGARKISGERRR